MEDREISVELTGPAKVHGVREPAGKVITVSATLALQLAASGVINPEVAEQLSASLDLIASNRSGDVAGIVAAAVADREGNWATAFDHFQTMAEDEIDKLQNRIQELEADFANEQHKASVLTDELADEQRKASVLAEALAASNQAVADLDKKLIAAKAAASEVTQAVPKKTATK